MQHEKSASSGWIFPKYSKHKVSEDMSKFKSSDDIIPIWQE